MQTTRPLLEIGITTKDRWNELADTLRHVVDFGWRDFFIRVVDDGSAVCCPFTLADYGLRGEIVRHDCSRGLIVRRNELARACEAQYYLSLDDDSYPTGGSITDLLDAVRSRDDWVAIGFPIQNPGGTPKVHAALSRTRSFIGCGHLLHRENFLRLGGYNESYVHQGEEMDISATAFAHGLKVLHWPHLVILHNYTTVARNWERMAYYGGRNKLWWIRAHAPVWRLPDSLLLAVGERVLCFGRSGLLGHLKGIPPGLFAQLAAGPASRRMTASQFAEWRRLRLV